MQRRTLFTLCLTSAAVLLVAGGAGQEPAAGEGARQMGLNGLLNRVDTLAQAKLSKLLRDGIARGWKVAGGAFGSTPEKIVCDVAIIGSGAGAGITAELLSKAGLQVLIIEEEPLKSRADFNQLESEASPSLYQESAARKTEDKAINILQGRCAGGSTTVNWTSSFRTPASTFQFWQDKFGLSSYTAEALAPYFAQAEQRLSITPWLMAPNENNDLLRRGAVKLGIPSASIARNVKGCWNLGSCGLGALDPHGRPGSRAFLHPVVMSSSVFVQKVVA